MVSFHRRQDVLRRTVVRSAILMLVAVVVSILLSVILFGADPSKPISAGYAVIAFVMAAVIISGSVGAVMSYRSAVDLQQLALVRAELWRVSRTDQLTGLLNRRGFVEAATTAMAKAKEEHLPTAALMCDVDRFKSINDAFGHEFGDTVLAEVGRLLTSYAENRPMVVGRYGGEEFVALLFGSNSNEAVQAADSIREACAAKEILHGASSTHVTISIGLTSTEPEPERSLESLLREADRALYEAKSAGRNRVVLADVLNDRVAA
jgi:diguanylate cyclase (GGDEF)-like protein